MFFLGTYNHTVDAKNRMFIPSKYRECLEGGFVVCKAPDKCLYIYTEQEFERVSETIRALPGTEENREFKRSFFGDAYNAELDKQGRFTLKSELKEYAGISENIIIIGAGNKFEVWDAEARNNNANKVLNYDKYGIDIPF